MITHVTGDLFRFAGALMKTKHILIPHVCNNRGAWGAGFVLPLAKFMPLAKEVYMKCDLKEGETYFALEDNVCVANMIAQTLYEDERALRYDWLVKCMEKVADEFLFGGHDMILAPKFGAGLAGGNWEFIECLITDIWVKKRIPVTIVSLS